MKKILPFIFLICLIFSGCQKKQDLSTSTYKVKVDDIVINKSHAYVDVNEKLVLLAQVFPFNADNQNIIWKSDNENIAIVNGGIVIGKSEGRTNIIALSEDGEYSTYCTVFVSTPKLNYKNYQNNLQSTNFNNDCYFQNSSQNFNSLINDIYELEEIILEDNLT